MKLKPEVKAKWLKKLRSGDYIQGKRRLLFVGTSERNPTTWCCLGILTALYLEEHGIAVTPENIRKYSECQANSMPDCSIYRWTKACPAADEDSPWEVIRDGKPTTLQNLNDTGVPFHEIANIIEEQM